MGRNRSIASFRWLTSPDTKDLPLFHFAILGNSITNYGPYQHTLDNSVNRTEGFTSLGGLADRYMCSLEAAFSWWMLVFPALALQKIWNHWDDCFFFLLRLQSLDTRHTSQRWLFPKSPRTSVLLKWIFHFHSKGSWILSQYRVFRALWVLCTVICPVTQLQQSLVCSWF